MLRIAVCDDEVFFTGALERLLEKLGKKNHININVEVFNDGQEVINEVQNGYCFDIIYMDIEMSSKNGLDAAKEIREFDKNVLLIYVTNYESYMAATFDYRPFQFIAKPVDEDIFEKYFLKAYEEVLQNDQYFHYKYNKAYYKILLQNVIYFESKKRVIYIVSKEATEEKQKFYDKLDNVEKALKISNIHFLRIHQSFLVNYRYVSEISYDKVVLMNGKTLYISEDRRKKISEEYCDIAGSKGIWC